MKEFIKEQVRTLLFEEEVEKLDPSKVRIKRQVVNNLLVFTPFYDGVVMGAFRMKQFNNDYKITAVVLYDRFKGKGMGKNMYRYIIRTLGKEGKKLYSDDHQSPDAKNVWDSLVRNGYAIPTENGYVSK